MLKFHELFSFGNRTAKGGQRRIWCAAIAICVSTSGAANATILSLHNFNDMPTLNNGTTDVTKENVVGTPILTLVQNGGALTDTDGVTGTAFIDEDGDLHPNPSPTPGAAAWASTTGDSYWELDVNTTGFLDLMLRFDNRSSGAGATSVTIAWAVDNGSFSDVETISLNRNSAFAPYEVDLSSIAAIENHSSVQIRGTWGTDGTGPNTRLDNLQLTGIPEPASVVLMGIAGGAMLIRRRRMT